MRNSLERRPTALSQVSFATSLLTFGSAEHQNLESACAVRQATAMSGIRQFVELMYGTSAGDVADVSRLQASMLASRKMKRNNIVFVSLSVYSL